MVKTRRQEYAESTRRAILDAARDTFSANGYASASLDEIASKSRVTKGALYHYFESKQALFQTVVEELEDTLAARITAAVSDTAPTWDGLTQGVAVYLDMCEEPAYRRIVLQDAPGVLGRDRWNEIGERRTHGMMRGAVESLMARGVMHRAPSDVVAQAFLAVISQTALSVAATDNPTAARAEAELVIERMLSGFRLA
jgi:AcrR family transcriptional regulator